MLLLRRIGGALKKAFLDAMNNHTMALAAGLSYYFAVSLFPLLVLIAAIVPFLPVPHLFDRILAAMQRVIPSDSMGLVRGVLNDVMGRQHGGVLTLGLIGTAWTASSGFASLIEALDVAYDVPEGRPIWKTRLLAIGLMLGIGGLLVAGTMLMFLGPAFGGWLTGKLHLHWIWAALWPASRWVFSIALLVLGVELILYWAPDCKQTLRSTVIGATMGVGFWIGASYALGLYLRRFANFNKTYGTLGAVMGLMLWLYWSWFFVLFGAEINAELVKALPRTLHKSEVVGGLVEEHHDEDAAA
jgi:membrane protein